MLYDYLIVAITDDKSRRVSFFLKIATERALGSESLSQLSSFNAIPQATLAEVGTSHDSESGKDGDCNS
jgi:hypothetical protein